MLSPSFGMSQSKSFFIFLSFYTWVCQAQAQTPLIWTVPEKQNYLVRREDIIQQIKVALKENPPILYLTGIPGIGKTQLAKMYAHQSYKEYDIVWWFNCLADLEAQYQDLATALNQLSEHRLNPIPVSTVSKQQLVILTNNALRRSKHSCLLIFDNVKKVSSVKDFIPKFSNEKNKHILLTSQSHLRTTSQIKIPKLKRQSSIDLLLKITQRTDREGANKVAEMLSDYPLSIRQAGFFLNANPTISFESYVESFKLRRKNLWNREETSVANYLELSDVNEDYDKTLKASVELTLRDVKVLSPDAFNLLIFMSFLETIDIPENLLKAWVREVLKMDDITSLITQLEKYSLVEIQRHSKGTFYEFHQMIKYVVLDSLKKADRQSHLKASIEALATFLPNDASEFTNMVRQNPNLDIHLQKLIEHAQQNDMPSEALAKIILKTAEYTLYEKRDFSKTRQLKKHLDLLLKKIGLPRLFLSQFKILQGSLYYSETHSFDEAIEKFQEALAITERSESYVKESFRSFYNMAQVYYSKGDLDSALVYCEKAEELIKNGHGFVDEDILRYIYARTLIDQGRFDEAFMNTQKALALNEKKSSSQLARFHILCIQNDIKKLQGPPKDFEEMTLSLKKEMDTYFGTETHYMAPHFAFWLAYIDFQKGNLENSLTQVQNAMSQLESLKKSNHRNFGEGLILLGDIYDKKNLMQEAYNHYLKAEAFFDKLFTTKKVRFFSEIYKKLALMGIKLKDMQIVQKYFHLLKDTFGLKNPTTLAVLDELDRNQLKVPWENL